MDIYKELDELRDMEQKILHMQMLVRGKLTIAIASIPTLIQNGDTIFQLKDREVYTNSKQGVYKVIFLDDGTTISVPPSNYIPLEREVLYWSTICKNQITGKSPSGVILNLLNKYEKET